MDKRPIVDDAEVANDGGLVKVSRGIMGFWMTPGGARAMASRLIYAAGESEHRSRRSCTCPSCGTFFAAEKPGQPCTCGQPLVAVEASL